MEFSFPQPKSYGTIYACMDFLSTHGFLDKYLKLFCRKKYFFRQKKHLLFLVVRGAVASVPNYPEPH